MRVFDVVEYSYRVSKSGFGKDLASHDLDLYSGSRLCGPKAHRRLD